MDKNASIFVAGHRGLVGSAILRELQKMGFSKIITRSRAELDLLNQSAVTRFFEEQQVDRVFLAAARVGGIHANSSMQADFLYENLTIMTNVLHAAANHGVEKLLFLGSSCIYPKMAPQPIREESLLSGPLEATNEGYAIAKIAGLKLCEMYQRQYQKRFISAMPTNLYGIGDNFHPTNSHVIPGMMRRFHEAKTRRDPQVVVWGSGNPQREFLFVDDLARALVKLMQDYEAPQTINVGTGVDCTIRELAETMAEITGFHGTVVFDATKPDGTPRKVCDISRIRALGWEPQVSLREGLKTTYHWALNAGVFGNPVG